MQSPWNELLQREVANDRLKMAGYQSRVERRRRQRIDGLRRTAGELLVAIGERLSGGTPAAPMRRA